MDYLLITLTDNDLWIMLIVDNDWWILNGMDNAYINDSWIIYG